MAYLGQRLLVSLMHFYRRHCSGRGPLRRLRCTFCGSESCSAYALRVAGEVASSFPEAVRLIRSRLRRCRQASLYRLPDGLGWGECFDNTESSELEVTLQKAHELPATVAAVLHSAALVARQRGQDCLAVDYALRIQRYPQPAGPVMVRDGRNWQRSLRRRLGLQSALAAMLGLMLAFVPLSSTLTGVGLAVLVVGCVNWLCHHRCRCRRFQMQSAAAAFRIPGEVLPDPTIRCRWIRESNGAESIACQPSPPAISVQ